MLVFPVAPNHHLSPIHEATDHEIFANRPIRLGLVDVRLARARGTAGRVR